MCFIAAAMVAMVSWSLKLVNIARAKSKRGCQLASPSLFIEYTYHPLMYCAHSLRYSSINRPNRYSADGLGSRGSLRSGMPASVGVLPPLRRLQEGHAV